MAISIARLPADHQKFHDGIHGRRRGTGRCNWNSKRRQPISSCRQKSPTSTLSPAEHLPHGHRHRRPPPHPRLLLAWWLSTFIQIAGWPIILVPLSFYAASTRRAGGPNDTKSASLTCWVTAACLMLGLISGSSSYLYSYSLLYLPLSTSGILASTQLAFVAIFAFLIVKQRFTFYSINAIFLLITGSVILGLQSTSDRPTGETWEKYYLGFFMALASAALYGMSFPLLEFTIIRIKQKVTYTLLMKIQILVSISATCFCLVGMAASKDFQAIPREARDFGLGETKNYLILIFGSVLWQSFGLGAVSIIWCSSSLLSGVVMAVLIPVGEVLAVMLLHEKFTSGKGISLVLALWGCKSYLCGEWKKETKEEEKLKPQTVELQRTKISQAI